VLNDCPTFMASGVLPTSTWILQILFGRYRSWAADDWLNLGILGCVVAVMMYVYLSLLRSRMAAYQDYLTKVPRSMLPLAEKDMSRRMHEHMLSRLELVKTIQARDLPPDKSPLVGDIGWSKASEIKNYQNNLEVGGQNRTTKRESAVHFNTEIAEESIRRIENRAVQRRHGLRPRKYRTIRDYVRALTTVFPSLNERLCERYIAFYERAVFSCSKLTQEEFEAFLEVERTMLDQIGAHMGRIDL